MNPTACNGCPQDVVDAVCGFMDCFTVHVSPAGLDYPTSQFYIYNGVEFQTIVKVNDKEYLVSVRQVS